MSAKGKETKYIKNRVPDEERCLFTANHGNRCRNPHLGSDSRHCVIHESKMKKVDEVEVQAVAEQLLANNVELQTKDDVNRFTSQLLTIFKRRGAATSLSRRRAATSLSRRRAAAKRTLSAKTKARTPSAKTKP